MASRHVEEAVQAYLTTGWTDAPILVENEQGEGPEDGSPFVRLQFPASNVARWPVDQRYYREEGGFRLVIAVERGIGTQKIRDWGEELAELFRDREFDGVITRAPSEVFTDDDSDTGNYFVGTMIVPYEYNFSG
jgi:hypothetical protein